MSPDGRLVVHLQEDGDVVVGIWGRDTHGDPAIVSAEFCAGGGGRRSPRTVEALKILMAAMQADNDAEPHPYDYQWKYYFSVREGS